MPCPRLIEGNAIRVTRVDACGRPVVGADNAVVSNCWASVEMAPNVNTGNDIVFPCMTGQNAGFRKGRPDFRGFDITGTFSDASPEVIEILTGNPVYFDEAGEPVGWDDCAVTDLEGFGLEVWNDVLTVDCADEADGEWFMWLLPWLSGGVLGNVTVGADGVTFTITASTRAGGGWELGPWDVQAQDGANTPGPLLTPIGATCHRRAFLTTIEPPTGVCGYITVPEVAS